MAMYVWSVVEGDVICSIRASSVHTCVLMNKYEGVGFMDVVFMTTR